MLYTNNSGIQHVINPILQGVSLMNCVMQPTSKVQEMQNMIVQGAKDWEAS